MSKGQAILPGVRGKDLLTPGQMAERKVAEMRARITGMDLEELKELAALFVLLYQEGRPNGSMNSTDIIARFSSRACVGVNTRFEVARLLREALINPDSLLERREDRSEAGSGL